MSLSAAMQQLMNGLSCVSYNGGQHSEVLIKEKDKLATLNSVTLTCGNGNWISLETDEGRKCNKIHKSCPVVVMSPLLTISDECQHHRACDSVIVREEDGKLTLLYIDLKSKNPTGYEGQFRSTRQFMRYVIGLLEEFSQHKLTIVDERYIVLHNNKSLLNKTTTVPKKGISKPNSAFKRQSKNGEKIYLKELLGLS